MNLVIRTLPIKTLCLLATAVALNGCGRKAAEPSATPAAQQSSTVSVEALANNSPTPPPPVPGQEPTETAAASETVNTTGDTVDPNLRAILVKFYNEQLHPAQSWDELLAGKYITKIPIGPDGKPLDWNKTMQAIGRARNPVQ